MEYLKLKEKSKNENLEIQDGIASVLESKKLKFEKHISIKHDNESDDIQTIWNTADGRLFLSSKYHWVITEKDGWIQLVGVEK